MKKTKLGLILGLTTTLATLTAITPAHSLTWTLNATVSNPVSTIAGTFDIDNESLGAGATASNVNVLFNGVTYDNTAFVSLGGLGEIDSITFSYFAPANGCTTLPCDLNLVFSPGLTTAGGAISLAASTAFDQNGFDSAITAPTFTGGANATGTTGVVPFEFREGLVSLLGIGMIGASHWWRNRKKN